MKSVNRGWMKKCIEYLKCYTVYSKLLSPSDEVVAVHLKPYKKMNHLFSTYINMYLKQANTTIQIYTTIYSTLEKLKFSYF